MAKRKYNKADLKLLRQISEKMPLFPRMRLNKEGKYEFVTAAFSVSGKELLSKGVTHFIDKGIKRFIREDETYAEFGYTHTDPYKFLLKRLEQGGPKALEQASRDYLALYEKAQKLMAEINAEKQPDIQKEPQETL
jgi:hypothetical protein